MKLKHPAARCHNVSESVLTQAVNFLPDPTFAIDLRGKVLVWNRAMESITHIQAEEIVGKGEYEYALPLYGERRPILIDMVLRNDADLEGNYSYIRRDGDSVYAEAVALPAKRTLWGKASPIYDDDGRKIGAIESIRDITSRKLAEEALKASEGILRVLFNQSFHFICILDAHGTVIRMNLTALDFAGIDEAAVLGRPFWDTPWWSHSEAEQDRLRAAIGKAARGELVRYVTSHPDTSGELHFIDFSIKPIRDGNGSVTLLIPEGRDITESMRDKEALRVSEAFLKRVFDNSRIPVLVMDAETFEYLDCNPAAVAIYGFASREETLGKTPMDVSAPVQYDGTPSEEKARFHIARARAEGSTVFEWRHRRPSGEIWDAEVHLMSFRDGQSELLQFSVIDITERRRVEQELRRSEARYRSIFENATQGIYQTAFDDRLMQVNPALARIHGYGSPEEMIRSLPFVKGLEACSEDRDLFLRRLEGEGLINGFEMETHKKDGSTICVSLSAWIVRDADGTPLHYEGIVEDITERRRAEEELRQSEEKYRTILETIPDVYFEVDLAGNLTFFNDGIFPLYGYTKEELAGKNYRAHTDEATARRVYEAFHKVYTTGTPAKGIEWSITRGNGIRRYIEQSASLIKDPSGNPTGFRGIIRDVTERKEAALERERLIGELQQALADVKTLRGMLPICSHCKKIRDDRGYWNQIENYISEHSDALFSHGICPECIKKHYPDFED